MSDRASFATDSTYTPDALVISRPRSRKVTIQASAGALARGTVLGKITSGGKYIKSLSGAGDGSQTPDVILEEDVPNSGSDQEALVYFAGEFNETYLVLGTAHTVDSIREGLRGKGINIFPALSAS